MKKVMSGYVLMHNGQLFKEGEGMTYPVDLALVELATHDLVERAFTDPSITSIRKKWKAIAQDSLRSKTTIRKISISIQVSKPLAATVAEQRVLNKKQNQRAHSRYNRFVY